MRCIVFMQSINLLPLLLCALLTACQQSVSEVANPSTENIRTVKVLPVQLTEQVSRIRYSGEIRVRHELPLGFQVPGKIQQRLVDVGTRVKKQQVLAILDPTELQWEFSAAQAQLQAAEVELALARDDLSHLKKLYQQALSSQATVQKREQQVQLLAAKVKQAQAGLALKQQRLAYTELRAPAEGLVTQVKAEVGQVLNAGQVAFSLARDDEFEASIHVPENHFEHLTQADSVQVSLWAAPQKIYHGHVREISPGVDEITRTFSARIALDKPDAAVHPGLTTTVQIEVQSNKKLAYVPLTALSSDQGQAQLWIVNADNRLQPRKVQVESYQEDRVLLSSGVDAGERIVTAGVHKLLAGQLVKCLEP